MKLTKITDINNLPNGTYSTDIATNYTFSDNAKRVLGVELFKLNLHTKQEYYSIAEIMRVIKDYKDGLNNTKVPLIEPVYELPPNLINNTELTSNNNFSLVNEGVVNEPIVTLEDNKTIVTLEDNEPIIILEDNEPIITLEDNEPIVTFEDNKTIEEPIEILKEEISEGLNNQEKLKPLNKKKKA